MFFWCHNFDKCSKPLHKINTVQPLAQVERSALWELAVFLVGELKFVLSSHGQQFVMNTGAMRMQVCYAGNLDFLLMVRSSAALNQFDKCVKFH